jgi:hypothetical protein
MWAGVIASLVLTYILSKKLNKKTAKKAISQTGGHFLHKTVSIAGDMNEEESNDFSSANSELLIVADAK